MKNEGATYKYVSLEEATKIMCYALSNWKITYHYNRVPERAELDLKNPENGDVMEIRLNNEKLSDISIYTDEDIVVYTVRVDCMKLHDVNRVMFSDIIDTMQAMQDYCKTRGHCEHCAFENDTDDPHYFCFLSGSSPQSWKLDKMRRPEIEKEN